MSYKVVINENTEIKLSEWDGSFLGWICPVCKKITIESHFKYCPGCGYKIKWSL